MVESQRQLSRERSAQARSRRHALPPSVGRLRDAVTLVQSVHFEGAALESLMLPGKLRSERSESCDRQISRSTGAASRRKGRPGLPVHLCVVADPLPQRLTHIGDQRAVAVEPSSRLLV